MAMHTATPEVWRSAHAKVSFTFFGSASIRPT